MKSSLGISNFLEEISRLSLSFSSDYFISVGILLGITLNLFIALGSMDI